MHISIPHGLKILYFFRKFYFLALDLIYGMKYLLSIYIYAIFSYNIECV